MGQYLNSTSSSFGVKKLENGMLGLFIYTEGLYKEVSSGLSFSGHSGSHLVLSVDLQTGINMTVNGNLLCNVLVLDTITAPYIDPISLKGYLGRPLASNANTPEFVGSCDEIRFWVGLLLPADIVLNYGTGPNSFEYALLHRYSMAPYPHMLDSADVRASGEFNGTVNGNVTFAGGRRAYFPGS